MNVHNNIRSNPAFDDWRHRLANMRGWFPRLAIIVTGKRWAVFTHHNPVPLYGRDNDNTRDVWR